MKRLRLTSPVTTTSSSSSSSSTDKFSSCFSLTIKSIADSILNNLETAVSSTYPNPEVKDSKSAELDFELFKLNDDEEDEDYEDLDGENQHHHHANNNNDDEDDDDDFGLKINTNKLLLLDTSANSCHSSSLVNTSLVSGSTTRRCLFKQSQLSHTVNKRLEMSPRLIETTKTTSTAVTATSRVKQVTPISCYKTNIIANDSISQEAVSSSSSSTSSLVDFSLNTIEKTLSIQLSFSSCRTNRIETIDELIEESGASASDLTEKHEIIMSLLDKECTITNNCKKNNILIEIFFCENFMF